MSFVLVDRPVPEVAVVTLNRPERMNAMAFDVMVPFRDQLASANVVLVYVLVVVFGAAVGTRWSGALTAAVAAPAHDGSGGLEADPVTHDAAGEHPTRDTRNLVRSDTWMVWVANHP